MSTAFLLSAVAFQTLKYVGVTYLLFIAWRTLKEKGALTVDNATGSRSATTWMRRGFAGAFVALGARLVFADR